MLRKIANPGQRRTARPMDEKRIAPVARHDENANHLSGNGRRDLLLHLHGTGLVIQYFES